MLSILCGMGVAVILCLGAVVVFALFLIGLNLVDDMNGVVVFLGVMAWIIDLALAFYIALSFFYYLGQGVRYSEASSAPVSVVEKK